MLCGRGRAGLPTERVTLTVARRAMRWGCAWGALCAAALAAAFDVNKCCERSDVMLGTTRCSSAAKLSTGRWEPIFTTENGVDNIQVSDFKFVIGKPDCETTQQWPITQYPTSEDKLALLPNGILRHYVHHGEYLEYLADEEIKHNPGKLNEKSATIIKDNKELFHDYVQGKYCLDKLILSDKNVTALFAIVCRPEMNINWSSADFQMRKLLNPIFHAIGMICFLIVAIIYFILPTLRDLTGNIVTTIAICLILSQAANLVRIFTEFSSHVSFMVADVILYVSLLAAFFWLNSFGYYIWKTFKSRNVFLRVTDGRKYCYYSCYAWGCTLLMCGLAIFAHFMIDSGQNKKKSLSRIANSLISNGEQDTIGWLGIAVFFTPIAFTVIINIFFYVTTLQVIKRMNTYGRIHHKLKHNFDMFLLMFIVMTVCWLFFLMSWLPYEGLMYTHIVINALQGPLMLYICVFRQTHVMFLLRKSCCYSEPVPTNDWGDEMTQMNGCSY